MPDIDYRFGDSVYGGVELKIVCSIRFTRLSLQRIILARRTEIKK